MSGEESSLTLKAYAKINLGLEVLGLRPGGFRELLHDTLTLSLQDTEITLSCNQPDLPCDHSNLAYRAAVLLRQEFGATPGVHIELTKRIPLAAGLAGGSTDAAAVLKGLNRLWRLALSPAELEQLATRLGSDVPFCLRGGTSLAAEFQKEEVTG